MSQRSKARRRGRAGGALSRLRGRRSGPGSVLREALEGGAFTRTFTSTLRADVTANVVRNVWAYGIIFCGHFPDQTYTFSQEEVEDEPRGGFYVRQLLGAANIEGSPLFHVASGNLGYQVEHHLYPDMPSTRYAEIAPRVKEICERYELPYNTGPFLKQLAMVQRTILRLAFPGGKPRPKPGPYRGAGTPAAATNGSPARPVHRPAWRRPRATHGRCPRLDAQRRGCGLSAATAARAALATPLRPSASRARASAPG